MVSTAVMAAFAVAVGFVPSGLRAQDVEMLAEHYGTTPPAEPLMAVLTY